MTIVITMAGLGSRFRKAGYQVPKYMIEAHEKTLFGEIPSPRRESKGTAFL